MALIKCKECGKEISDTAKTCPNCGAKNKKTKLKNKKIIFITSSIILLFVLILTISLVIINNPNTDNFSSKQVVKYLERKGYVFDAYKIVTSKTTAYYLNIKKDNIELLWRRYL